MLVDSGSSFSYLPAQIFEKVADEVTLFFPSLSVYSSAVKVSKIVLTHCFGRSLTDK